MQRDKRADVPVTSNLAVFNDELYFLFGVAIVAPPAHGDPPRCRAVFLLALA